MINEKFSNLKIIYYRSDKYSGHLAMSGHRLDEDQFEELMSGSHKVGHKEFSFERTKGDELQKFWENHLEHFDFCTRQKRRYADKNRQNNKRERRQKSKLMKNQSFDVDG